MPSSAHNFFLPSLPIKKTRHAQRRNFIHYNSTSAVDEFPPLMFTCPRSVRRVSRQHDTFLCRLKIARYYSGPTASCPQGRHGTPDIFEIVDLLGRSLPVHTYSHINPASLHTFSCTMNDS